MLERIRFSFLMVVATLLLPMNSFAVIEIEITKGGEDAIPIAIVPFGWTGDVELPVDVASVVAADLERSGQFSPLNRSELIARPVSGDPIDYANWRLVGADYIVIGTIQPAGKGYVLNAQILDVIQQKLLSGIKFDVTDQTLRSAAHQIADEVFEKILGIPGSFNTQIAYVSVSGPKGARTYQLELADADGVSPQPMLASPRPIMSPAWAPDGIRIAYVSFEDRERSAIYIQNRVEGSRQKLISREGINGAPSWSPDGKRLAVVLSDQGSADIYIIDIGTKATRRITTNDAIDTEPVWLDNDSIIFTSDRSGGPQLYKVSSRGGKVTRITFEGDYNASPTVSADGRQIAFVHRSSGGYQIGIVDQNSGSFRTLTNGSLDESPSFSPNGQMILFATEKNGRGILGAVSIDGDTVQNLTLSGGSVREPAWSPPSN